LRAYSGLFFSSTAHTAIYTLSLHDALPILGGRGGLRKAPGEEREGGEVRLPRRPAIRERRHPPGPLPQQDPQGPRGEVPPRGHRSEEHTSELQSRRDLVCRLLLEKKNHATNSHDLEYVHLQEHLALKPPLHNETLLPVTSALCATRHTQERHLRLARLYTLCRTVL